MDNIAFVQKVKMLCLEKDVKPSNVCAECGLGTSFLPDVKRGRIPSVGKVQQLAAYLGVTTSELLGEVKPTPVPEDGLSDIEKKLIQLFRELNQEGQEQLVDTADTMVSSGKYIKSDTSRLGKEP